MRMQQQQQSKLPLGQNCNWIGRAIDRSLANLSTLLMLDMRRRIAHTHTDTHRQSLMTAAAAAVAAAAAELQLQLQLQRSALKTQAAKVFFLCCSSAAYVTLPGPITAPTPPHCAPPPLCTSLAPARTEVIVGNSEFFVAGFVAAASHISPTCGCIHYAISHSYSISYMPTPSPSPSLWHLAIQNAGGNYECSFFAAFDLAAFRSVKQSAKYAEYIQKMRSNNNSNATQCGNCCSHTHTHTHPHTFQVAAIFLERDKPLRKTLLLYDLQSFAIFHIRYTHHALCLFKCQLNYR